MRTAQILVGDVRERLRGLPDQSVQCVVTSPPYFALRDYGVVGQIGLEETPDAYVCALVDVFRSVQRVLRDDGILWLNLGDTYCNSDKWGGGGANTGKHTREPDGTPASWKAVRRRMSALNGIKPKDLIGAPWMVAFALRADGWYLRSDIIWSKPNPMPESVTDRPTKAHEYIFLLTKSDRYYYNAAAIREGYAESTLQQIEKAYDGEATKDYESAGVQNPSDVKRRILESVKNRRDPGGVDGPRDAGMTAGRAGIGSIEGRNKRTVWTVTTQPYPEAHFATYPEDLIEPCILAGSREGDTVLDPFCGSGTTGVVACRHNRHFIGIELNQEYAQLAEKRIRGDAALFNSVEVA